jgi:hypothetical protein
MGCQYLDEYYELWLLGTLSGDAWTAINEHVERDCPYCLGRLREAARTVYMLSQSVRLVRPDPKRKSHLLRRLHKK